MISGKWHRNEVHFIGQAEVDYIVLVVRVNRGELDNAARKAHVFLFAQFAVVEHLYDNEFVFTVDSLDYRGDLAVAKQDWAALVDGFDKLRVWAGDSLLCG